MSASSPRRAGSRPVARGAREGAGARSHRAASRRLPRATCRRPGSGAGPWRPGAITRPRIRPCTTWTVSSSAICPTGTGSSSRPAATTATRNRTPTRSSAATDGAASWWSLLPELARACALERPDSHVVRAALRRARLPGLRGEPALRRAHDRRGGRPRRRRQMGRGRARRRPGGAAARVRGAHSNPCPRSWTRSAPRRSICSRSTWRATRLRRLAGLDLERHAPRYVLVEMRDPEVDRVAIEEVLGERYMDVDALSPFDILYARVDVADAAGLSDRARR